MLSNDEVKMDKRRASIKRYQVEVRKRCMLVAKVAIKQHEVMTFKALKKWDRC